MFHLFGYEMCSCETVGVTCIIYTLMFLTFLFLGVFAIVIQRKQKLESVLDIWTGFESKRRSLELFIDKGEGEMEVLFGGLKHPSSVEEINKAIAVLEVTK